jgi:hypothetical protein
MAPELGQFIQDEHAVGRPRPLARHGHLAAADQPHIRDRPRRSATWARRDQYRAGAGAAGDAVDARSLERFREGHCWQDGHAAMPRMERLIKESEEPGGECPMPSLMLYRYRHNVTFELVASARGMVRPLSTALGSSRPPSWRGYPAG